MLIIHKRKERTTVVISCEKHTTPMRISQAHTHSCWEIIYTLSGEISCRVGSRAYEGGAGNVAVIPPRTVHSVRARDTFTDMFVQTEYADFTEPVCVTDSDGSILTLMELLHRQMVEKGYNYLPIADGLYAVICQCIRKCARQPAGNTAVSALKNELYRHISDAQFDLAALMKSYGYTENYLRSCFRLETGLPPLQYLTHLRITQAKSMMVQDDFAGVAHVAAECGFADSLYFSTCFKRHTGLSPLQYRAAHREAGSE